MIRVLRVLEYEFKSLDDFEEHKTYWKNAILANNMSMASEVVRISKIGESNGS